MKPQEVASYEQRLDHIIAIGDQIGAAVSIEAQAHFGRYLTIVSSGYVEKSMQTILYEYAKLRANPAIANFVEDTLRWQLSLNIEKIEKILRRFDPEWVTQVNAATTLPWREAVNSLKALRDIFAHGGQNGTGYLTIKNYQADARRYISAVCDVVLN